MSRSNMSALEWEFMKCVLPNNSRGVNALMSVGLLTGYSMHYVSAALGVTYHRNMAPIRRANA